MTGHRSRELIIDRGRGRLGSPGSSQSLGWEQRARTGPRTGPRTGAAAAAGGIFQQRRFPGFPSHPAGFPPDPFSMDNSVERETRDEGEAPKPQAELAGAPGPAPAGNLLFPGISPANPRLGNAGSPSRAGPARLDLPGWNSPSRRGARAGVWGAGEAPDRQRGKGGI